MDWYAEFGVPELRPAPPVRLTREDRIQALADMVGVSPSHFGGTRKVKLTNSKVEREAPTIVGEAHYPCGHVESFRDWQVPKGITLEEWIARHELEVCPDCLGRVAEYLTRLKGEAGIIEDRGRDVPAGLRDKIALCKQQLDDPTTYYGIVVPA